jgi:uncharacterized membrane protein (UPF0127 family)
MRVSALPALVCLLSAGCSSDENVVDAVGVRMVRFPNGRSVRAEVMTTQEELGRGMMYRDALPQGRGMLFVHSVPGNYSYFMYQVKIPLDLVFMDANQRVVYIEQNAPPCPSAKPTECKVYGPNPPRPVQYVLELGAGEAGRYGLKPGDQLRF